MNIANFLDKHENKTLLRFITCGSVDDGKSTLIGRLLYDSKLIFDDQIRALQNESKRIGTNRESGKIDYALLLDGLKAEREQGITIDVAYRYFSTPERKFIIADTPGHEQYTRNMATGASTASLAIILIDARKGILTQTRRHSYIVSQLGIKHIVIAVNKMDLVDYSQEIYEQIKRDFSDFAANFNFSSIKFFPLSALEGANVVSNSSETPWYKGPALLEYLEKVDTSEDNDHLEFRFPVQYVNRPNLDFRGFAGSVVSGVIKKGDKVQVLPSMKTSRVKEIVTYDGNLPEAHAPQAVTLTLEDEIDISSGDMLIKADNLPHITNQFKADIIWMTEKPLTENSDYIIRHCGSFVKARVSRIAHRTDVNTLENSPADHLELNETGEVMITTFSPLFFDTYKQNRETGSFIIIDNLTNNTAGVGTITGPVQNII
ncbi:sulfate adenylyltransferase subunit CysN [Lentisphaerota bacterium ZTH]|nr:sulfate adenylyltransferase subunit CysN [Lentisphaerota bacterium]WET07311.1 sulfate adenylyltransferase subunit CysN [Lentisphaerota bacterium ZTH]